MFCKFLNFSILYVAPTQGHLKVRVHDEAYARIHVGILGFNYDFFLARVCFKGSTEYNINILQVKGVLNNLKLKFKLPMSEITEMNVLVSVKTEK